MQYADNFPFVNSKAVPCFAVTSRIRHRYTFIASYATEAAAGGAPVEPKIKLPAPGGSNAVDVKISKIADDISSLTLMEVSQLLQLLKVSNYLLFV